MSSILQRHADEIEVLLEEHELSDEARERLAFIAEQLRLGRTLDEIIPPNIRVDEPIPGRHREADAARAASPTGDLPRTDISPPTPPEEIVPPHAFAPKVPRQRQSLSGDLNPSGPDPVAPTERERQLEGAGAPRFYPGLPPVESAVPPGSSDPEGAEPWQKP